MIVSTQRLFRTLLDKIQIGVVCDVGSMDGADWAESSAAHVQRASDAIKPCDPQKAKSWCLVAPQRLMQLVRRQGSRLPC
jgi:hypothetical protein